ncbi:hypothetical protein ACM66B_003729 [Microbotryomycetes sp. NB124-2]
MDGPRHPRDARDERNGPPRGPSLGRDRPLPRYGRDARDSPPSWYAPSSAPRPRERYRSPPPSLAGPQSHSSAGPYSLPRDRWAGRGSWDRASDHSGTSSGRWDTRPPYPAARDDHRPSWRDDERDRDWEWDRKAGPSRPFMPDGARSRGASVGNGGFEIPYRNRAIPLKRGRGETASDEEDGYPTRRPVSRPASAGFDKYPAARSENRTVDDRSHQATPMKFAPVRPTADFARARNRSLSPGELSEGQIPTSTRSPTRSASGTPPLSRTREPEPSARSGENTKSKDENAPETAPPREGSETPPVPPPPPETIPLVSHKTNESHQLPVDGSVPDTKPSAAAIDDAPTSAALQTSQTTTAPATTEASAIRVEPTSTAETKVTMTLSEPAKPATAPSTEAQQDGPAQTASKHEPEVTSFVLERPPSPPTPPLIAVDKKSPEQPLKPPLSPAAEDPAPTVPQLVSPSSPLTSLPPTSPAIVRQQALHTPAAELTLNVALLPPIDLHDKVELDVNDRADADCGMDIDEPESTTGPSAHERDEDDSTEGTRRGPSPQDLPSPPQPDSPPNQFKSVLEEVIAAHSTDNGEANSVVIVNRARTEQQRVNADVKPRQPTMFQVSDGDRALHAKMLPLLLKKFKAREERRGKKMVGLREQYKQFNEDWSAHCKRLEQIKERILRRNQSSTVPATPAIDGAGLPFYPEPATPGPSVASGRAMRRSAVTGGSFGYGDAVRSEAEFLEILASLETADMRDPTVRATRTAAVVPDMIIDDTERREFIGLDDDSRRKVDNPVEFYGVRAPLDLWTEDEVQVFCKRFAAYPKQFGRIASALPDKTTAQCVLFYYRMKNTIDFRSLSDRRGPNGKRRKPKRKLLTMDGDKKGSSSLLSNLQRTQTDERDEDEVGAADSPPPSPQATRRLLPSENAQVFRPPDLSIRDDYDEARNGVYEDDDSYFARPIKPGKGQKTPRSREVALAADNAAAETFADGDDADDASFMTPGAAADEKARKRKQSRVDAGVSDTEDYTPKGPVDRTSVANVGKRKTATSSYWTVAERTDILRLLGVYGKDWSKISERMGNKTAIQCRNWYQNNVKKLKLEAVVRGAAGQGDSESGGSPMPTPGDDYSATASASNGPRAGFFLPDQKAGDGVVRAGMQIRNLLNDAGPADDKANPSGEDWFGANDDGGGSATTEEEIEQRDAETRAPPSRPSSMPHPYGHERKAADGSEVSHRTYYAHHHPSLARLGAVAPHAQSIPSPLASWHSSPAGSPSPAFSPFGPVPGRQAPFDGPYRSSYDRVGHSEAQRPASAGSALQSTNDDYFAARPQYTFAHTTAYAHTQPPYPRQGQSWPPQQQ